MAEPNTVNSRGAGLKFDGDKPRASLLIDGMPRALARVADVLTFGAAKYKAHSWKQVENGQERYNDAKVRHQLKRAEGEVFDSESGIEHLAHEACNALFLLELALIEKENMNVKVESTLATMAATKRAIERDYEQQCYPLCSPATVRAGECL